MEYAEVEEDEVLFECNLEFSMIINSSPVWFSFDDIDRFKKKNLEKQFKLQDVTGFLDMKENKAVNYLKFIFTKSSNWV